MTVFTDGELRFLQESGKLLARIATVGKDGTPHVVPTGWSLNATDDTIEIGGHDLTATKKYKDAARTGQAAVVIDEVLPPWRPRGIEVRGRAETIDSPTALIRVYPERVVSWGIESEAIGERHSRRVR